MQQPQTRTQITGIHLPWPRIELGTDDSRSATVTTRPPRWFSVHIEIMPVHYTLTENVLPILPFYFVVDVSIFSVIDKRTSFIINKAN